ncbi:hypothetical protein [Mesorhizobium sp. M0643]|uniref:hypothetical protein n=1 Tax=unclassified Mesorhizobium TaxID=325217 RepID=UPI00333DE762
MLVNREMADMAAAAVAGLGLAVLPRIIGDSEPGLRRLTGEILGGRASRSSTREAALASSVLIIVRFLINVMQRHFGAMPR